jgi:hypothetical protein
MSQKNFNARNDLAYQRLVSIAASLDSNKEQYFVLADALDKLVHLIY